MNEDFKRRSDAVFENLRILVGIDSNIIFLGGSAIQALLKTPKRLSIDLDIAYSGEVQKLIKELEKEGYEVKQRKSRVPDFIFYNISKEGVLVKLDISKLSIPETEKHIVRDFAVFTPKLSYFIASKLSALAFDTIGRLEEEPQQIIKDVFDINCILDLQPDLGQLQKDWLQIIADQNRLRKTRFTEYEGLSSAQKTLLKCIDATPLPEFFIPPHSLGSFQDALVEGKISRRDIVTMAARALTLSSNMNDIFYETEKSVLEKAKNASKLEEASHELIKISYLDARQITTIKTIAPVALMYLLNFKNSDNSVTAFIRAIYEKRKIKLVFFSKEDNNYLERTCAPMDYGPSRRTKDNKNRLHVWDYDSDREEHTLSLPLEQIKSLEILPENFDPSEFITWDIKRSPWFIKRNWGNYP